MSDAPKLLDVVRARIRSTHYSIRTEKPHVYWIRWFIRFHDYRHSRDMGKPQVEEFLTFLAVERKVAAATQNQALSALLFLYQKVLEIEHSGFRVWGGQRQECFIRFMRCFWEKYCQCVEARDQRPSVRDPEPVSLRSDKRPRHLMKSSSALFHSGKASI